MSLKADRKYVGEIEPWTQEMVEREKDRRREIWLGHVPLCTPNTGIGNRPSCEAISEKNY